MYYDCSGFSGCQQNCGCPTWSPICLTKGDTFVLYVTYSVNGVAFNLTGGRAYLIAKTSFDVPDAGSVFEISTSSGDIIFNSPTTGQMTVTIPSSATLLAPFTSFPCVYNLVFESGSGTGFPGYSAYLNQSGYSNLSGLGTYRATIQQGIITVKPNVLGS